MPSPSATPGSVVLQDIVQRLVVAYRPRRIYLFGSMARGDAGVDSDYDVLVVVDDDAGPERRQSRLGYQALQGTGYAVDVLVWRESEFDVRLSLEASLPATVQREGRLLYAA
ncbi:MAG: nucleotidyltransferase domain-containing protein [Vicinamibacterales bacterium]